MASTDVNLSRCLLLYQKYRDKYRITMNRLTFLLVFVLGVVFALLVPVLRNSLNDYHSDKDVVYYRFGNQLSRTIASLFFSFPDDAHLSIVNEDYDPRLVFSALKGGTQLRSPNLKTAVDQISQETEALSSLHAAVEMKKLGKPEKSLKLFQHALALCPKHPDILNHYGEFLEETQQDLITADHLYQRALTYSPEHLKAMENRQRTLPLVQELDELQLRRIDQKRDNLINIPDSNSALRRIKKEAYFQHIYHTVGIEGNTMSLAQTRHIVETRLAVGGKSIMEHNEILGLNAALKYINTTLVHKVGRLSLDDLLEIHRRVVGYADPLEAGLLRRTQVYVSDHVPPPPSEIQLLMEDFIQWLNSAKALQLHPVKYAALAHYKFVFIHPFSDGNGRSSRLLMNLILMQAGYPPVIIRKQERLQYHEYLEFADEGDIRPFVRFIADCTERTLDVYLWATTSYSHKVPALDQENEEAE